MAQPTHVTDVDVVVIGAGIIGASCAYHLSSAGQGVAVLEARRRVRRRQQRPVLRLGALAVGR